MHKQDPDKHVGYTFSWLPQTDPAFVMRLSTGERIRRHALHRQIAVLCNEYGRFKSENNTSRDSNRTIGERTAYARRRAMHDLVDNLRALGYKLEDIRNLKQKHFRGLAKQAVERGLAPKTIHTLISHWRTLASWIKKPIVVPSNRELLPESYLEVKQVATANKSWSGHSIDWQMVFTQVAAIDAWVANVLAAERLFALRVNEALQLRPRESDQETVLWVHRGTKGGRERRVPIENSEQRALLDELKRSVTARQSLAPADLTLAQASARYYRVVRTAGISKKALGVTSHGLRHERLQEIYVGATGESAPIAGGSAVTRELDLTARLHVAHAAGHNRVRVSSAYLGPILRGGQKTKAVVVGESEDGWNNRDHDERRMTASGDIAEQQPVNTEHTR